jgi:signal transduction histidine kinase
LLNAEGTHANVVAEYLAPGRASRLGGPFPMVDYAPSGYQLEHRILPLSMAVGQDKNPQAIHQLMAERHAATLLLVPIPVARGRVAGSIGLVALEHRDFNPEEVALAQSVAAAAGQALETARLYQALRRHAEQLEETVAHRTLELQEALELARAADRVKSEFVSNVSHELRTPLTNIKLYLSLMNRGAMEKRQSYQETVRREVGRLQDLIEGLLDLSRLELGKTRANMRPTDLNLLLKTLAADRGPLVADRRLQLEVQTNGNLPLAMADPKLTEQVLTNLLTNAINYTRAGGKIRLSTALVPDEDQRWITVTVTDTGPGISPEEQERLFERFYRGEAGRASDAPGTGLGLAICKEIMDLHDGRITVESEIDNGSAFTIWLSAAPDGAV